jgi:hypothetical protein
MPSNGDYASFHIRDDPVCDHCSHGRSLHVLAYPWTCVACGSRQETPDCPGFGTYRSGWRRELEPEEIRLRR